MSVHFHYIIACLVCEVIFIILHRKSSNARQLFGMVLIPTSLYFFLYKYSLLPSWNGFEVYATSVICIVGVLFLCTLTLKENQVKKEKKRTTITFILSSFFLIAFTYGIPWLVKAFPLDNPDAVLFTLLQNKAGTDGFVWDLVWKNILSTALLTYVPICIVLFLMGMVVWLSKKKWCFNFFRIRMYLHSGSSIWVPLRQLSILFFVISFVVFCVVVPKLFFPVIKLCGVYFDSSKRVDSQLYLNEYVFPDSVEMTFPSRKRNLIYIMMESMEVNFKEYTPEINRLVEENVSFYPGGVDLAMTNWTMAAQVAKMCGIPLNVPRNMENSDEVNSFLPNVKCLPDILAKNGYNQIYVQGSDGTFASKRQFWNQHHVDAFHDFPYYKKKSVVKEKKEIFWGVTDRTLYNLIKRELQGLTKDSSKPFALYAMTVDTHFPDGYLSEGCYISENDLSQFPSVLRCSAQMLDSFLKWAKEQDWYWNTTIVVVGDHSWGTFTDLLKLPKEEPLYWINFFINSQIQPIEPNRIFSSFDMFPTVLASMGVNFPLHRLGLGTSLFSAEKTLLEKIQIDTLNAKIREKTYQYDYFMNGGSFKRE